jgi:hypothetical protein
MFFVSMVGTPRSLSAPARGSTIDVFTLMVGAPRSLTTPARAPPSMFSSVDGGCSRILRQHLLGGLPTMFQALMVGALGFSGSTSQGATVDIFYR